jgi:hypothetical protein
VCAIVDRALQFDREERYPDATTMQRDVRAVRKGDSLTVYSFVILEDGRYELQAYERRRTADGLDLAFERIVDGTVVRRMSGHAVRAE